MVPDLEDIRSAGVTVLAVDYPGYGGSAGSPSADGIRDAAEQAYAALAERVGSRGIVVAGRSIGSGPACHLAARQEVAGVALFAPFTRLADAAARHYPFLPVRTLLRHRFDNMAEIAKVEAPVLLFHNVDDELIAPVMSEKLAEAAAGPVTLVLGSSGGHNGLDFGAVDPPGAALREFLATLAVGDPSG